MSSRLILISSALVGLLLTAVSTTNGQQDAPSVVGKWRNRNPELIGHIVFKADGTGASVLGDSEAPFTWSQSGKKITARQTEFAKLRLTFEIEGDELKTTDPGAKTSYVRMR
jgi:hypothetical protein